MKRQTENTLKEIVSVTIISAGIITAFIGFGILAFSGLPENPFIKDVAYEHYKKTKKNVQYEHYEKTKKEECLLQQRNVIGNETPDKFYEINGQRAYLEIDGMPVEGYIRKEFIE